MASKAYIKRNSDRVFEFGPFRLDEDERLLLRDGEPVALTPKVLDTLLVLVERNGHLVEKEDLMKAVWPDSFVEEANLNRSVSTLRRALGDDLNEPRYIETVPKRGYRFIAAVTEPDAKDARAPGQSVGWPRPVSEVDEARRLEQEAVTAPATAQKQNAWRFGWKAAAIATFLVALVGATIYALAARQPSAAETVSPVKSLAVLPFKTLGATEQEEYLELGITDALITTLSNISEVNVRPTSAVLKYVNSEQGPVEVGRALMVDAVLEGSIQQVGDRIRVTVRLLNVNKQAPVWAGKFDEPAADILKVQDSISERVVNALRLNLNGAESDALTKRYTKSADAYRLYIKGRYHWNERSWEGMMEAQYFFRQAIEKDPSFALAYVGLADTLLTDSEHAEALDAINKALELDSKLGEAYATSGFANMFHKWDWPKAEERFKRAIELSPGYATAHQWYATLLAIQGRLAEAKLQMRRALEIDPQSHNFLADLAQMHYFAREYQEAEAYCRKALEISPGFLFAHQYLFDVYAKTGKHDQAFEEFLKENKINESFSGYPTEPTTVVEVANRELYQQAGLNGVLRQNISVSSSKKGKGHCYQVAKSYALLGEKEEALDWLERSCRNRDFLIPFVNADPIFDDLRSEPRYRAILRRLGLTS